MADTVEKFRICLSLGDQLTAGILKTSREVG